ncbi:DUF4342 domain-containing protein [Candidatus Contubernalis alkaliaceticus]|uniref:DUF4342 domain-containing protein n=1 Tax=Candidatus Contubernalis alkaliaceticus TaxID=338645 RepID=UPI001F4C41AB|nr:DUF4342 domain-containing protein [Candidatus Contubernalis alkalaceticus]UNC92994.1 DUF4342 domain-containing protein [Candidatus Contubernalis alkalaceticus]
MSITLEKIDLLRDRTGATYKEARLALEATGGEVVEALIILEDQSKSWLEEGPHTDFIARAKEFAQKSADIRISVKSHEKTVVDIPAPLGVAGAVFLPKAAALGTLFLLFTKYSLHMEKRQPQNGEN